MAAIGGAEGGIGCAMIYRAISIASITFLVVAAAERHDSRGAMAISADCEIKRPTHLWTNSAFRRDHSLKERNDETCWQSENHEA